MDVYSLNSIDSDYLNQYAKTRSIGTGDTADSFDSILSAIMGHVEETNELQNAAESEEIRFALGQSDNTHDLLIAESKASVALQYTVAVRDRLLESYNQIMQMQI